MSNQDTGFPNSEVTYPTVSNNGESQGNMVPLRQPFAPPSAPFMGGYAPAGPEILTGSFNQTWLMNCLRRRWLLSLLMGILVGIVSAVVLLWAVPTTSSVVAYLQVKSKPPTVMGKTERLTTKDFEIFVMTQIALLKSHFVLQSAINRTDISQLDAIRKEDDPVQWLVKELRVSRPQEGEILEVKFTGHEDSGEIVKIIDAVLNAFRKDVLQEERTRRDTAHRSLKTMHTEIAKDLEKKMKEYEKLAEELGGDPESVGAASEVKMLMNELTMIQQQINRAKGAFVEIEVAKSIAIQSSRSQAALDAAVQDELALDPTITNYLNDQFAIDQRLRQLQSRSKQETSEIKRLRASSRQIAYEMEQYRLTAERKIRQRLKSQPNERLSQAMIEYNLRRKNLDQRSAELEEQYQIISAKIQEKGKGSTVLSLRKEEIGQLRDLENEMNLTLRNWIVEDKAAEERVRVIQPATPLEKINTQTRLVIAAMGGLVGFCATCYVVAFMEFRLRRLNDPTDIDEGLGIRVLGVLPPIASRKALAVGSPIAAQVSDSIDNVRATLMYDSTSRPRQVVLVTSPATMEGSTTVASHLAVSLSRAGRRTLIVDGDLREPSLHKLFGLPLESGFSEVLRAEVDVSDAIHPTSTEGLWLLTAGVCDVDAIHALATDQPRPMFEQLRDEFDFVIIDGAPVLGLSDMLSLGQHVDGAILTVLRDHSGVRQIHRASELLKDLGIRLIGAVVNGVSQKSDRRITMLHKSSANRAPQLPVATEA